MGKTKPKFTPKYRKQSTSSGARAFVELSGRRVYLGPFNSVESRAEYHRVVAEWEAAGRRTVTAQPDLTVRELCLAFMRYAEGYYGDHRELDHFKAAIKTLRALYDATPAGEFGPLKLKAVRELLITDGKRPRTRQYVNRLVARIRYIFKWAVAEELVSATVHQALETVPGLKSGRTKAPDAEAVKPVPEAHIEAVRPLLSKPVRAMVDLQLLTAARPGELCIMRPIDIDTTGKAVWTFTPQTHKGAWRGHSRTIYLGPKSQEIIKPFLAGRAVEAFMFSPAEAVAEQREDRSAKRKTPLSCGNKPGSNVQRKPKKEPGVRYTPRAYYGAILYACRRAWPCPPEIANATDDAAKNRKAVRAWHAERRWHPYALRHNAATNIRKQFGLDVAAVMLGHSRCDVTQVYAEKNHEAALQIAAKIG